MSDGNNEQEMQMPAPDPALGRLDRLVGSWDMRGRTLDSDEDNIHGRSHLEWLPGGFFLQQRIEMDFAGFVEIQSLELIGHDPETGAFSSLAYSNLFGAPAPYSWDLRDDVLEISTEASRFRGTFSEDGDAFSGGWRPVPGMEGPENIPYDIGGTRVT